MSVKKLLGAAMWQGLLLAMLTSLALLAVSSLMLQRGLLPESTAPSMVCVACAAAVFAGGRRAVRRGEGGPLPQAAAVNISASERNIEAILVIFFMLFLRILKTAAYLYKFCGRSEA